MGKKTKILGEIFNLNAFLPLFPWPNCRESRRKTTHKKSVTNVTLRSDPCNLNMSYLTCQEGEKTMYVELDSNEKSEILAP